VRVSKRAHVGCGASTLISNLLASTSATHTASSTKWEGITALRHQLQDGEAALSPPLLAAFACVLDYCRIIDIEQGGESCDHQVDSSHSHASSTCSDNNTFFIERLHHTRLSQTLCQEEEEGVMDPALVPASAFCWPKDLPTPALVVYLVLPPPPNTPQHIHMQQQCAGQIPIALAEYNKIQVTVF
jgi:hypothetical protein